MMLRINFLSIIIFYISLDFAYTFPNTVADVKNHEADLNFDYLMFTQNWPATVCKLWINQKPGHHCNFPRNKDQWTIHGIWPLQFKSWDPAFCNNSLPFDPKQIKSLEEDLEQVWTNIHKESKRYHFWRHEWDKHGTCSAVLKSLNSQFKYFSKGIEWNQKYSLADMLSAAKILPSDTRMLKAEEFGNAVKAKTGGLPMISCALFDGVQSLWEIRMCFDMQQNVMDCESLTDETCDVSKGIIYPIQINLKQF